MGSGLSFCIRCFDNPAYLRDRQPAFVGDDRHGMAACSIGQENGLISRMGVEEFSNGNCGLTALSSRDACRILLCLIEQGLHMGDEGVVSKVDLLPQGRTPKVCARALRDQSSV